MKIESNEDRSFENRLIKSRRSIPSIFPPNKFCRRKWTDRISKRLCHVRNTALSNVGNDFTNRIDSRIQRTAMSASNVSSALDSWAKPVFCDLWSLELPSPLFPLMRITTVATLKRRNKGGGVSQLIGSTILPWLSIGPDNFPWIGTASARFGSRKKGFRPGFGDEICG